MENDNSTIKLVEELVSLQKDYNFSTGELATLRKDYNYLKDRLYDLIGIILDSSRINYNDSGLTIKDDDEILQYIKFFVPDRYEERLESLRDNFKKEARESKTVKEARKDGK